ncbi:MAG: hypothetical protein WCC60_08125, partial [Ilumatobacteraceae bacterium]
TSTVGSSGAGVLAIGETVMLGATQALQQLGFEVDAVEGRGTEGVALSIDRLRDHGTLPDTVVLHVGTNAPLRDGELEAIIDRLADRSAIVVTVHGRAWADANNAIIRALPERYTNVRIADWDQAVADGTITGLTPDGVHLDTAAARDGYAALIAAAVDRAVAERQLSEATDHT